jgi:hypothetical protein
MSPLRRIGGEAASRVALLFLQPAIEISYGHTNMAAWSYIN